MNTPKGMEVLPKGAEVRLTPLGPEWIAHSLYGFQYGLCEQDGQQYLCACDYGGEEWQILIAADRRVLRAFQYFRESHGHRGRLSDDLTAAVLLAVREKGLAS